MHEAAAKFILQPLPDKYLTLDQLVKEALIVPNCCRTTNHQREYSLKFIRQKLIIDPNILLNGYRSDLKENELCPDPHFKRRHKKRRVVQEPLVYTIVNYLTSGGQVFVQSDVLEVALDMRNQFDALSDLQHMDAVDCSTSYNCDQDGWLLSNPFGIRTEREIHAELEGAKIYRRMYQKTP